VPLSRLARCTDFRVRLVLPHSALFDSTLMSETFSVTRTLAASPDLVWQAWTRPEYFSVWFGTHEVEVPLDTLSMDVRVGGELKAVMHLPDGTTIDWAGEYVTVDYPKTLAFTLTDAPTEYPGVPVVATFVPIGDGTEVTITQDRGDFDDDAVAATIAGYNAFVDSMEQLLASL
jgi:uncharacterized protein YndB with AHSA1/START domain